MSWCRSWPVACLLTFGSFGCDTGPLTGPVGSGSPEPFGEAVDTPTGTIGGRVIWSAPVPEVPDFLHARLRADGQGLDYQTVPNPNRPQIDTESGGLGGAVVMLRRLDASGARPWNHAPVRIEIGNGRVEIIQGPVRGRVGFVRVGDDVQIEPTETRLLILRGRGDDFFGLTLPPAARGRSRTMNRPGRVELSDGTGAYWARAYLMVSPHPYLTLTQPDGHFQIKDVPIGSHEVTVWHPGWEPKRSERDPDSTAVVRMEYSPPLERSRMVTVTVGQTVDVEFRLP